MAADAEDSSCRDSGACLLSRGSRDSGRPWGGEDGGGVRRGSGSGLTRSCHGLSWIYIVDTSGGGALPPYNPASTCSAGMANIIWQIPMAPWPVRRNTTIFGAWDRLAWKKPSHPPAQWQAA